MLSATMRLSDVVKIGDRVISLRKNLTQEELAARREAVLDMIACIEQVAMNQAIRGTDNDFRGEGSKL